MTDLAASQATPPPLPEPEEETANGLSAYEHVDPEKHLIGETLAAPSQIATAGIATIGVSPVAAREDHFHGYGISSPQLVTMAANFANYGSPYPRLQVIKGPGNLVFLQGFITTVGNPAPAGAVIGTLPSGYTPILPGATSVIHAGGNYTTGALFAWYTSGDNMYSVYATTVSHLITFNAWWYTTQI